MAKPEFSDDELERLVLLGKHAENSLRIGVKLLDAEATHRSLTQLLASLDYGVLLLDRDGRSSFKNSAIDDMITEGVSIQKLIAEALRHRQKMTASFGVGTSLVESSQGARYALYSLPVQPSISSGLTSFFENAHTLVLVRGIDRQEPLDPTLLRDLLGLTLAEARVASLVGIGMQPKAVASKLAIAEDTARKALKAVFAKTCVSRQAELALLISRIACG